MSLQILTYLFEIILMILLLVAFIIFLLSSFYDIKNTVSPKLIKKVSSRFRGGRRPTVTVLVYAYNNADSIVGCLDSIRKNRYSGYDVVVINDSSSDETRKITSQYKQKYPSFSFRFYSKRRHISRNDALSRGYFLSKKGDYVLVVDANITVDSLFIKNSTMSVFARQDVDGAEYQLNSANLDSIVLLFYKYLSLVKSAIQKSMFVIHNKNKSTNKIGNVGIYKNIAFLGLCQQKTAGVLYNNSALSGVFVATGDQLAINKMFSFDGRISLAGIYKFILAVTVLVLQTYSMYVAATAHDNLLLIIGYVAVLVWLSMLVVSDAATDIRDKLGLVFGAVGGYILIYVYLLSYVIFGLALGVWSLFVGILKVSFR